jgi:hypothetical protein
MRLGWPFISSSTQPSPVKIEVWYGILLKKGAAKAIAPVTRVWTKTPATKMMGYSYLYSIE